ncbi:DUF3105 domain-containing protein [Arthrobacter sp. PAMC25284]|uniref:DUF3105 domain-containing protein n=1 Tax=Arthrobacter sp. PAMC25284 TaxID=2861279 RepID=UPI001C625E5F|nr:DUF3105 domain-containing protein [Arthrobacter sp. PAMC25284]QYF90491.1 DUF3105 domain-containing protein [Arthrobacter sp. PAMC25284]
MSNAQRRRAENQRIVADLRNQQRAKQRRFNILLYGGFGLLLAGIITAVTLTILGSVQEKNAAAEAAKQPIEGIQTFTGLSRSHVEATVDYPQQPGVGGDHAATWTNCGIYTEPVNKERAVHSLEHGAVSITYGSGLAAADITTLTALATDKPFVLLSPGTDSGTGITATAWGAQLTVTDAADPRIANFIRAYAQSPDAPEPGAPCTGGVNS